MINKNQFSLIIFSVILGSIITLLAVLISRTVAFLLLIILVILGWIVYDRIIVKIYNLQYLWWSPHRKLLKVDKEITIKYPPEIIVLNYILEKGYNQISWIRKKEDFLIRAKKSLKHVTFKAIYENYQLSLIFYPMISKNSINEMKEFENYLKQFK